MDYIPTPPPPSAAARDLAKQFEQVIRDYRARHRGLSDGDVRRALQLSAVAHAPRLAAARPIILTVAGICVALGIGLMVSLRQHAAAANGSADPTPAIVVVVAVLAAAAGLAIAVRHRLGG